MNIKNYKKIIQQKKINKKNYFMYFYTKFYFKIHLIYKSPNSKNAKINKNNKK